MKIDSHQHFWKYSRRDYGWIGDEMAVIRRDFLPRHLKEEIGAAGIDGVISVQARQSLEETEFLLDLAGQNDFVRGVVGWFRLSSAGVKKDIERFSTHEKLKGCRHVLQEEPDDRYMLREEFNRGVSLLKDFALVYDILIYERHLPQILQFVDRHPDQTFVLDHMAKPRVKDGYLSPWQTNIVQLSHRPNVYCKLSGLVTEADYQNWTKEQLVPYMDTVLSAFGPKRMMFGSDWPVCLAATSYQRWFELVADYVSRLSESEQARILGETAVEAYNLAS